MSVPISKPGFVGYSIPLSTKGDLHCNFVDSDHWTVRLGKNVETHLNTQEMESMIEAWRTNQLGMNFKAFG